MDEPIEAESGERWTSTIAEINGCPFYRHLGMEVEAMGDAYARLRLPVKEDLLQIYGTVHGGATASLADSAVAVALISVSSPDQRVLTVELKLNFLAAATKGVLIAEARLFHRGRTISVGDVEVRNGEGRLIAKGIVTYMSIRG